MINKAGGKLTAIVVTRQLIASIVPLRRLVAILDEHPAVVEAKAMRLGAPHVYDVVGIDFHLGPVTVLVHVAGMRSP